MPASNATPRSPTPHATAMLPPSPRYPHPAARTQLLLCVSALSACGSRQQPDDLYNAIEQRCFSTTPTPAHPLEPGPTTHAEICRIVLSELIDVPWDRVAFIADLTPPNEVSLALGVQGLGMPNLEDWIVFAESGRVVRLFRTPIDLDHPADHTAFIAFDALPQRAPQRWRVFTRQEAVFDVLRHGPDDTTLVLTPVVPAP